MMRERFDSLLSSLGAVTPRKYQSDNRQHLLNTAAGSSSGSSSKRHPVLQEFERKMAEELDALTKAGEELGFLSTDWLPQALSVVLSTHTNVHALIPFQDDKCVRKYLDDSAKLLEICKVLQSGFQLIMYPVELEIAISQLQGTDLSYREAQYNLLNQEFLNRMPEKRWRSVYGCGELELEKCHSMLRTMSRKLISFEIVEKIKSEATGNRFFNVVIYGAKVTTIFLLGLVLSALTRHPLVTVHVSRQCLWASSMLSLQQRVKVEINKHNTKSSSIPLLPVLNTVDMLVSHLYNVVNKKLTRSVEYTVNATRRRLHPLDFKTPEAEEFSPEAEEFRSMVASLNAHSKSLYRFMEATRDCLKELNEHFKLVRLGAQHLL